MIAHMLNPRRGKPLTRAQRRKLEEREQLATIRDMVDRMLRLLRMVRKRLK